MKFPHVMQIDEYSKPGERRYLKRRKARLERRLIKIEPDHPPSYGKYQGWSS
jgi:hypothetical protein